MGRSTLIRYKLMGKMEKLYWYLKLIPKLGFSNVVYVQVYRLLLKYSILKFRFSVYKFKKKESAYHVCRGVNNYPSEWKEQLLIQANKLIEGSIPYYSSHWLKQSNPPNWFINPFNGAECNENYLHWTEIADFNKDIGDIKNIWEISRFSWLSILARAYVVSGEGVYLDTINGWIKDWLEKNPVNQGPNWKCGQEASFRVFNLLNAAHILNQEDNPSDLLIEIIEVHVKRISGNLRYAIAQRNNHATSEASALLIGASWLERVCSEKKSRYKKYARVGRAKLERAVNNLVYEDGAFAQHSVNYHRLFLDTLSLVVFWQRNLKLKALSQQFMEIAAKSFDWLLTITDQSGYCPNIGSNDGTMLQGNHSCDYQDFRPSLQVASFLFTDALTFEEGRWNEALFWYDINLKSKVIIPSKDKSVVKESGYVVMKNKRSWALLHYPNYKFRPSHNDIFHFDLWFDEKNVLFDSGSYSYNPDKDSTMPDFKSVLSHNTVSFDGNEQMPRLSRFLLGNWIKPLSLSAIGQSANETYTWKGSYIDYLKNIHSREVKWSEDNWQITDCVSGTAESVIIGFNFDKYKYSLDENSKTILLPWGSISVSNCEKIEVISHSVSQYYMKSRPVNRLVITANNNSEVTTSIKIFK
ncbi:hypothetical protein E9993_08920 [Labilibacter sediminis]|nr:hypothetical protein E9993_08920 [Labilibacter sediminis]